MSTVPTIRTLMPRATFEELQRAVDDFVPLGYRVHSGVVQAPEGFTCQIINDQPDPPPPLQLVKDGIFVRGDHNGDIVIRFNCQHEKFAFAKGLTLGAILLTLSKEGEVAT